MRHLPKHLRPRWRYLAVECESWPDAELRRRTFQSAVWASARALLGDPGSAALDLRVVRFRAAGGDAAAMVRVRREAVEPARAAIACVGALGGTPVRTRVRGVSGTMRACEEKYMGEPGEPGERRVEFRDAGRRALQRGDRVDVETDGGFTGATGLDVT